MTWLTYWLCTQQAVGLCAIVLIALEAVLEKLIINVLRLVVVLTLPVFLVLTAARLMIGDWFPRYEYSKPGFPAERYGWTQQERLQLALPSIHFLNSPLPAEQAVQMLAEQKQPGTQSLLFTQNELSHMVDVKRVVDRLWRVHIWATVLLCGSFLILLIRPATRPSAYLALMWGGILTTVLLLLMAFFVMVGFDTFFVQFHEIFFPQGNWTFDYTDSLIRLFPEPLWFDAGFMITVGPLIAGILIGIAGYLLWRHAGPTSVAAVPAQNITRQA